ncbi:MAG: hypothetical protein ACKN9T_17705 [Candidatus Methylumidiphilus sp.]
MAFFQLTMGLVTFMTLEQYANLAQQIRPAFQAKMREERLPVAAEAALSRCYLPLAHWLHTQKPAGRTLVLGVNGAQGSGKSTLCAFLTLILREAYGYNVAGLSIDDLYLTRAERLHRAQTVHPLFATRGVPGTHDVAWGLRLLDALTGQASGPVALPCFDKAADDRRPEATWPLAQAPADVVILEGWCVGLKPQAEAALDEPVNDLERDEDSAGVWRRQVNRQLAGPYAELFARLDRLLFLRVPSFDCVSRWRGLQEQKLAAQVMDAQALHRFIMHYERLTRHALDNLAQHADLTLDLNDNHELPSLI